ncbi:MAG: 50S ribosomal protein L11 methyltransferase [Candidatus Binatia bacterium]
MDKHAGQQPSSRPQTPRTQPPAPTLQSWLCLSIPVPHEAAETVARVLVELGSIGVIESERDFTEPASSVTTVQGFFPSSSAAEEITAALANALEGIEEAFPGVCKARPQVTEVNSEAWAEQWRGHFPPLRVGYSLRVLPPWESVPNEDSQIVIVINPSMAFGTGHHATTQGCLRAIEDHCRQAGPPERALDIGTGSGILAIALAKFGTPTIWATDIDPIALDEAGKNIVANQVTADIRLSEATPDPLSRPFPFVVANLFSFTLISLASDLARLVTPAGFAVVSGIQLDQESDVLAAYSAPAWQLVTRYPIEEWVTLVLQRT